MPPARRLAAILAADVVGYSHMMGENEAGTARAVRMSRDSFVPLIAAHGGRLFKTMGDGFLVEFPSVVAAVECALALQTRAKSAEAAEVGRPSVVYRMGVSLGDVLVEGDDLVGDGVNVAARLEGIAPPGGLCISAAAFEHVRGRIEARFEDLGELALKNIPRPVRAYSVAVGAAEAGATEARRESGRRPPRLSLVVLPFGNFGGSEADEYFVDGVTESLTTELSRIAGAFVIARNTAFIYKNKAVDARQVGRDLGVRYVIEGSVQRGGQRMRVNVQLIEAETGAHLWADRFDKPIADLFEMQDEIVARIASELSAQFVTVEARRAEKSANPDALDYWFRGHDWINKGVNPETLHHARECFLAALKIDPDNIHAKLGVAFVDLISTQMFSSDSDFERLASAERLVTEVLAADPRNAQARYCLGLAYLFSRRVEQAIRVLEETIAINGNIPFAHAHIGLAKAVLGRPEEMEGHVREAMRLSPHDIAAYVWYDFAGIGKLLMGLPAEAVPWCRRSVETTGNYPVARFHLAAALALSGRIEEGKREVEAGLALAPNFTIRRYRERTLADNPVYLEQRIAILDGLRLAGAPEG